MDRGVKKRRRKQNYRFPIIIKLTLDDEISLKTGKELLVRCEPNFDNANYKYYLRVENV